MSVCVPYVCFACCGASIHGYSGYIGEFEIVDDHRAGKIVIEVRETTDAKNPGKFLRTHARTTLASSTLFF